MHLNSPYVLIVTFKKSYEYINMNRELNNSNIEISGKTFIILPGVPREVEAILKEVRDKKWEIG